MFTVFSNFYLSFILDHFGKNGAFSWFFNALTMRTIIRAAWKVTWTCLLPQASNLRLRDQSFFYLCDPKEERESSSRCFLRAVLWRPANWSDISHSVLPWKISRNGRLFPSLLSYGDSTPFCVSCANLWVLFGCLSLLLLYIIREFLSLQKHMRCLI